jgi:nitrous oxide reductase accessory protein NosL
MEIGLEVNIPETSVGLVLVIGVQNTGLNTKTGNKSFGNLANSKCLATSLGGRICSHDEIRAD